MKESTCPHQLVGVACMCVGVLGGKREVLKYISLTLTNEK